MRGRWIVVVSLCALSYVASASVAAAASHPQERHGFWIGFGGGPGFAHVTCDDCENGGRETGADGYLKLGGTLNEHVLLGGEFNLWTKEQGGVTVNLYNASATLTIYPRASAGFFIKGGVGAAFVDTEFREGGTKITADLGNGLGLLAGAGYDLRVGKNISITPAVNFWYGAPGDLRFGSETVARNWKQNVIDLTLGVTFH
jgi:hypothetical protein